MGRKLILDTGVLIAIERGAAPRDVFADDDDPALAAISLAEWLVGVGLATPEKRPARQAFIDSILGVVPVEDYTATTAEFHARLMVHTRRNGDPRGDHDLVIAATAAATGRTVVTTDKAARFDGLPGVKCIVVGPK